MYYLFDGKVELKRTCACIVPLLLLGNFELNIFDILFLIFVCVCVSKIFKLSL